MKKISLLTSFIFLFSFAYSQDSTKVKTFNHEVGFNTVSLLRQIILFKPGEVEQLPFDIFYNLYFQDKFGLRVGAGILTSTTETLIRDQPVPRVTKANNVNYRVGLSYNFAKYNRVTLNVFGDFLSKQVHLKTTTTTTIQQIGDPITTLTVKSSEEIRGTGAQAGVGLKFDVYKQLSLYLEVPVTFMAELKKTEDHIEESGMPDSRSSSMSWTSGTRITLPSTIYLVLRF